MKLAKKRIERSNKILSKKKKEIYFEISKFFIRSYCEKTTELIPDLKLLYLTRHPLMNAISFYNRNKIFEKDNFGLNFNKNNFKISDLDLFEKYLWMWIEVKLRLIEFMSKYKIDIIHFKSENINDINCLYKLFDKLNIKYEKITLQENLNTNKNSGFKETQVNEFFLDKYNNFKKKIPNSIKEKVPEFYKYNETQNFI